MTEKGVKGDLYAPQTGIILQEVPRGYLMRRIGGAAGARKSPLR